MRKNVIIGISVFSAFLVLSCGRSDPPGISTNDIGSGANTAAKPTTPSPLQSTPVPAPSASIEEFKGSYRNYPYYYTRKDETVAALFAERFLPRDDAIVIGATRDVIRNAFKEETYGTPALTDARTSNGTLVRGIRLEGPKHAFVVVPVKEDTGEVHSLTITRIVK